ncbi:MAG: hypothetical protein IKG21_08850 [Atopobiaceae bacterium]|nr:hypothetical protein [Atopobiaceae bacterium]
MKGQALTQKDLENVGGGFRVSQLTDEGYSNLCDLFATYYDNPENAEATQAWDEYNKYLEEKYG